MPASFTWLPGPSGGTPMNAANLNRLAVTADIGTAGTPTGDAARAALGLSVVATVSSSDALAVGKFTPVDASAVARSMTLPTGAADGVAIGVEKVDSSANVVSVTGNIRGVPGTTITLPWQHETLILRASATGSWWPVAGHKTKASLDAAYVPKWKPSTAYASGDFVLNPSGQIVSANTAFTSGATYSASNWTVVATQYQPEFYGAGYSGAASDDWGPAISAAISAAAAAGTNVTLKAATYGIRTTITWPAGVNNVKLIGTGRGTLIRKLSDVTLIDQSGTSSTRRYACGVENVWLDGGNNSGWTAPLQRMDYTSRCHPKGMYWFNNYGPAVVGQRTWDTYFDGDANNCGGTDGATPAFFFTAVDADGGNACNNLWFDNLVIETWRSGGLWCVGTAAAPITLIKIDKMKVERVTASTGQGPALRFGYCQDVDWSQLQVSSAGSLAAYATAGYAGFMHVYGCTGVRGGQFSGFAGSVAAGDMTSMFFFDGATATNNDIRLGKISLHSGSGSSTLKPTCVFKWSGTNTAVDRGSVAWDSNYWSVPTDAVGTAPTSLTGPIPGAPVVTAATDTGFASVAQRTAVDGDEAFLNHTWVRQGGAWVPSFRTAGRMGDGSNAATLRHNFQGQADRLGGPISQVVPGIAQITWCWLPLAAGDTFTKFQLPVDTAYVLGTSGYGYWMALYAANGTGPTSMTLLCWTGELSSASLTVGGAPESRVVAQDASNASISSYTVPAAYDSLCYVALYLNPGTGGTTGKLNGSIARFNNASAAFTGQRKLCMAVTPGSVAPPPTTQAVSGAYNANIPLIGVQ